jgi:hypothetical protein
MTGWRNENGETSGPNSMRLVFSASQVREDHSSRASRTGPVGFVKWSERYSPA